MKSHHPYKQPLSPPPLLLAPTAKATVPAIPLSLDEIKCEPRAESPAISDERCDEPVGTSNFSQANIPDSDGEPKGMVINLMYIIIL